MISASSALPSGLLYHARHWVSEGQLRNWVEYLNMSMFRDILINCHKEKLLEYDQMNRRAILSPSGLRYVEANMSLEMS